MFNIIKWAFKLGRQTEKARIYHELVIMKPPYKYRGSNNAADDFNNALNKRVNDIIDAILEPTREDHKYFDELFPRGEDK